MNTAFEFDHMLDEVLSSVANPSSPEGMAARLTQRFERNYTMSATLLKESSKAEPVARSFNVLAEPGVLSSLWESIRGLVRPRLPELVLESRPILIPGTWERMQSAQPSRATMSAVAVHALVILALVSLVYRKAREIAEPKGAKIVELNAPPPLPQHANLSGGGGGRAGAALASKGALPKIAIAQIVPPKAPPLVEPKIAIQPTIELQQDLKMAKSDLPQMGLPTSPLIGTSLGVGGKGGGIGAGTGNGIGPGSGGNMGGGIERIGGGVSAPVIVFQPEPEFSEEARKAKVAGNVLVYLQVDASGHPQNVRVIQGMGLGLDEKAIAAVRQYRFKPAMKDGKPVRVEMHVEVNFQIF